MANSVDMINQLVAVVEQLPKTAGGDYRVEDPSALAVAFVGIVAPLYQEDIDAAEFRATSAESLARAQGDELIGLRAENDARRQALAAVKGHLDQGDVAEARAVVAVF